MKNTLARSALRAAAGSTRPIARSAAPPAFRPTAVTAAARSDLEVGQQAQMMALRAFSASTTACKKAKKSQALDETAFDDDLSLAEDDLFGETTTASAEGVGAKKASTSSASSRSSECGGVVRALRPSGKRWNTQRAFFEEHLSWGNLDKSREPALSRWRHLAGVARTQSDIASLLSLAEMYRDRVGSLGVQSGARLASRAAAIGYPELALNGYLDRYKFGIEADLESLYLLQKALWNKTVKGKRKEVLESAGLEGVPEQETDMLAPIEQEGEGETAASPYTAEEQEELHARLSLLDRMALLVLLTPPLNHGYMDPVLLSFLPSAYIKTFNLTDPTTASNPHVARVVKKVDELISLLTTSTDAAIRNAIFSSHYIDETSSVGRSAEPLSYNFRTILYYVATAKGGEMTTGQGLDPVRVMYAYMEAIGKSYGEKLVKQVEPALQGRITPRV